MGDQVISVVARVMSERAKGESSKAHDETAAAQIAAFKEAGYVMVQRANLERLRELAEQAAAMLPT